MESHHDLYNQRDSKANPGEAPWLRFYTKRIRPSWHPCSRGPSFVPPPTERSDSSAHSGGLRVSEDPPQDRLTLPFSRSRCEGNSKNNGKPNYRFPGKGSKSTWAFHSSTCAERLLDRRTFPHHSDRQSDCVSQTRCPFQNDWRGNGGRDRSSSRSLARERRNS